MRVDTLDCKVTGDEGGEPMVLNHSQFPAVISSLRITLLFWGSSRGNTQSQSFCRVEVIYWRFAGGLRIRIFNSMLSAFD
jgi:hypothetical protein